MKTDEPVADLEGVYAIIFPSEKMNEALIIMLGDRGYVQFNPPSNR